MKLKIRIPRQYFLLYLTLFSAVFNDFLRVPNTEFSLFRVIMWLAWVQCLPSLQFSHRKIFLLFLLIMLVNGLQTYGFHVFNSFGISVPLRRYIRYAYFAFCIFTVIYFTLFLSEADKDSFPFRFLQLLMISAWGILVLFLYLAIFYGGHYKEAGLAVSNVNDYGMYLNLMLPIFVMKLLRKREFSALLFCLSTLIGMIMNNCRISLLAAFLEIAFLVLFTHDRTKKSNVLFRLFALIGVTILFVYIVSGRITYRGESFQTLVWTPLIKLLKGDMYLISSSSIPYRVNVTIMGMRLLKKSACLGIGFGNANLMIRSAMEGYSLSERLYEQSSISMHNAPLELLLDYGLIAVIFYVVAFRFVIKVIKKRNKSDMDTIFCSTSCSLPVWILSPAGITTSYFLFIVITYYYLAVTHMYDDNRIYFGG